MHAGIYSYEYIYIYISIACIATWYIVVQLSDLTCMKHAPQNLDGLYSL